MLPGRRPKGDCRRLPSTGDVVLWIVKYFEKRCYRDEDQKGTADIFRQQVMSGGGLYSILRRDVTWTKTKKRTADVYRQQVTSGGGLCTILSGYVTWTKTERGQQTSSVNR
jgi:hypothetical protein